MPVDPHNTADRTPHRNAHIRDILEMQQVAKRDALEAEKPMERAAAMRAWDVLEERRAILKGKPGSITSRAEPEVKRKPKPSAPGGWADPTAPGPGPSKPS